MHQHVPTCPGFLTIRNNKYYYLFNYSSNNRINNRNYNTNYDSKKYNILEETNNINNNICVY